MTAGGDTAFNEEKKCDTNNSTENDEDSSKVNEKQITVKERNPECADPVPTENISVKSENKENTSDSEAITENTALSIIQ